MSQTVWLYKALLDGDWVEARSAPAGRPHTFTLTAKRSRAYARCWHDLQNGTVATRMDTGTIWRSAAEKATKDATFCWQESAESEKNGKFLKSKWQFFFFLHSSVANHFPPIKNIKGCVSWRSFLHARWSWPACLSWLRDLFVMRFDIKFLLIWKLGISL